jgi:hypothetical protein
LSYPVFYEEFYGLQLRDNFAIISESERNTANLENSGSGNISSTSSEQTAEIDQSDTDEDIYGQTVDSIKLKRTLTPKETLIQ